MKLLTLLSAFVGLAIVLAATLYVRRRGERSPDGEPKDAPKRKAGPGGQRTDASGKVAEERRAQPRWLTRHVVVTVADADSRKVLGEATVYDRSVDGVRLVGDLMLDTGARLFICPRTPGESNDGAKVEVRYCRRADSSWVLGCKFTEPLSLETSARLG
jgi:PilZ domain